MTNLKILPDQKLVIIPDIHNNFKKAEKIIRKEDPDKIMFLGDYFDDFDDTIRDAVNTAQWLKKSLKQKNRIHLIGNHDLNYMTDNPNLKCAGYGIDKHNAIKEQNIDWANYKCIAGLIRNGFALMQGCQMIFSNNNVRKNQIQFKIFWIYQKMI